MESPAHLALKLASTRWLRSLGCCAAASEVRCPLSRWRLDAAGFMDADPARRAEWKDHPDAAFAIPSWLAIPTKATDPTTIIIECKAYRSDFLRDARTVRELVLLRERLMVELTRLDEEFVKPAEPHLRREGNFLFAGMESWDLDSSASTNRRTLVRALRRVDSHLHASTKFFMLRRYRLASHLLIVAEPGVVEPCELPTDWGLAIHRDGQLEIKVEPARLDASARVRQRLLRNLAAALTWREAGPSTRESAGTIDTTPGTTNPTPGDTPRDDPR